MPREPEPDPLDTEDLAPLEEVDEDDLDDGFEFDFSDEQDTAEMPSLLDEFPNEDDEEEE